MLILGSQVSMMQVLGYSIALGGIQIYGIVSREPSRFQGRAGEWQILVFGPNGLGVEGVEDVRTEVCWLPEGRLDGQNPYWNKQQR